MILFLFLALVGGLALLWPADLAPRANVLVTPTGIKPEWYFLGLFQLIKLIPEVAGLVLVGIVAVLLLVILPFIDRSPERNPRYKPVTTTIALVDHRRPHRADHLGGGVGVNSGGRTMKPVLLGLGARGRGGGRARRRRLRQPGHA